MNESMYLLLTIVIFQPAVLVYWSVFGKGLWSLALWYDLPFQLAKHKRRFLFLLRLSLGRPQLQGSQTQQNTNRNSWVPLAMRSKILLAYLFNIASTPKNTRNTGEDGCWSSHRLTKHTPWTNIAPVYVKAFQIGRLHLNATPVFQVLLLLVYFREGNSLEREYHLKGLWFENRLN